MAVDPLVSGLYGDGGLPMGCEAIEEIIEMITKRPSKQEIFDSLAILEVSPDVWNHYMGDVHLVEKGLPLVKDIAKRNYRRLVLKHHPDRGGDVERFCQIQAAWECVRELKAIEPKPVEFRVIFDFGINIFSSSSSSTVSTSSGFWS